MYLNISYLYLATRVRDPAVLDIHRTKKDQREQNKLTINKPTPRARLLKKQFNYKEKTNEEIAKEPKARVLTSRRKCQDAEEPIPLLCSYHRQSPAQNKLESNPKAH